MHEHGKIAIAHMCGHIRDLLPLLRETGLDGLNFVSPPPTGDTPFADVFRVLGEDYVVYGAIDPSMWIQVDSREEIQAKVRGMVTEDLLDKNLMLSAGADGLPGIPVEKFMAIREALADFICPG